jgi:parallel beta-helix repeat protein
VEPVVEKATPAPMSGYTTHAPIVINGNSEFTSANGVTSGSGTQTDPYIIEGYDLNTSNTDGIYIGNTTAYFVIKNCYIHNGWHYGVSLKNVKNGYIINNLITKTNYGIYFDESSSNTILKNNIYSNGNYCVFLWHSNENKILNNQATDTPRIVSLYYSSNNLVSNNNISSKDKDPLWGDGLGIYRGSNYNTISNNRIFDNNNGVCVESSNSTIFLGNSIYSNDMDGLKFKASSTNTLWSNMFQTNGISVTGVTLSNFAHTIPINNTINGKIIYYYLNQKGLTINNIQVGQLFIVNCSDIKLLNLSVCGTDTGLEIIYSSKIEVKYSIFSNNKQNGIYMFRSNNNTLSFNICDSNPFYYGIGLFYSNDNVVSNNQIINGNYGINTDFSDRNLISKNVVQNNLNEGIVVSGNYNVIINNCMSGNDISTSGAKNIITSNIITTGCGILVSGETNTISFNKISNASGIYLYGINNIVSDNFITTSGYIGISLEDSFNTISNNIITGNSGSAIYIKWFCDFNKIFYNTISNNGFGIYLEASNNNVISNNNIIGNSGYGLGVYSSYFPGQDPHDPGYYVPSNNNQVYHNNFFNNNPSWKQAFNDNGINQFNATSQGNYWSDWTSPDNDHNGIVDNPYVIDGGHGMNDYYPLINPVIIPKSPSAPQNLKATTSNTTITLTWQSPSSDGGSSITNYEIYRSTISDAEILLIEIGNVTTYTDLSTTSSTTYYYKVCAKNAAGEGPLSNEVNETTLMTPSSPQNLQATSGNGYATLAWFPPLSNGNNKITNYIIYRGDLSGTETKLTEISNITSFKDTGIINGNTYFYKVGAKSAVGEGPLSNEASAMPTDKNTIPTVPRNVLAIAYDTTITLTWEMPASDGGNPITNYKIYRGTSQEGESFYMELSNVLTLSNIGLNPGTYYYKISAKNAIGESPLSDETNATIQIPNGAPSAPLNLNVTVNGTQVTLKWNAPNSTGNSSIMNYRIFWGTSSSGNYTEFKAIGNLTTYTFTNLTRNVRYYFTVSAINSIGEGPKSNEASAIIEQKNKELIPFFTFLSIIFVIFIIAVIAVLAVFFKRKSKPAPIAPAQPPYYPNPGQPQ